MKLDDLMLCQTILQEFSRFFQIEFTSYFIGLIHAFFNSSNYTFHENSTRVEIGRRADCCVRTRLKATLCLLKRKRNGTS